MEWKYLSEEAKGIIEWVINPFTNHKETIEIKIGEAFQRRCPKFCGDFAEPLPDVKILITEGLYQEVFEYVSKQKDMEYEKNDTTLIFRLKNGVKI